MRQLLLPFTALIVSICATASAQTFKVESNRGETLSAKTIAKFDSPWAMTFISKAQLLVTTKPGKLWLVNSRTGNKTPVSGLPKAVVGGQGGLGDVVPHPDFKSNGLIYVSLIEPSANGKTRGAAVFRGKLDLTNTPKLTKIERVWTQLPKRRGKGHFSHRIAFGPKGSLQEGKLFITSGDRQEKTPAQRWDMALGKIIRLNHDGSVPKDNPYQDKGDLAKSYWTTGHRNLLGIAFDPENRLWSHEMGPRHGDELNLIEPKQNYGWPIVSNGNNYSGTKIPNHNTRPEFAAPKTYWVPSIAPSGLVLYSGKLFPNWQGDAFIGGLVSKAVIHVDVQGETAKEQQRFRWGKRIREVEQGPNGALWVLEDKAGARLLRLTK